jgi:hypothetical protein
MLQRHDRCKQRLAGSITEMGTMMKKWHTTQTQPHESLLVGLILLGIWNYDNETDEQGNSSGASGGNGNGMKGGNGNGTRRENGNGTRGENGNGMRGGNGNGTR